MNWLRIDCPRSIDRKSFNRWGLRHATAVLRVCVNKRKQLVKALHPLDPKGSHMSTTAAQGVINPDELYTLTAFTQRLGIRQATVRAARRAGLQVYYVHKHAYVYGRDWIDYVLKHQECVQAQQISGPA